MSSLAGNPWKIGLFVVVGVLAIVMSVFWLASQHLNPEVLSAITYFNESVEGIDVGTSIKIRGVKVGVVSDIGIAPDHRMVRVRMKLFVDTLRDWACSRRQSSKWRSPDGSVPRTCACSSSPSASRGPISSGRFLRSEGTRSPCSLFRPSGTTSLHYPRR
jgi:hypothetical protein